MCDVSLWNKVDEDVWYTLCVYWELHVVYLDQGMPVNHTKD